MLTLGIHDGHTATACLMEDGQVRAAISEERLNGEKEWKGFPEKAVLRCLEIAGRSPGEVDAIGICSIMPQTGRHGYYHPGRVKRSFGLATKLLPPALLRREANIPRVQALGRMLSGGRRAEYAGKLRSLGFTCPHTFYEHHLLHAATAYYTNYNRPDPGLVLTLDGSGDAVCGTVQVGEKGELRRRAAMFSYNSICEFYTRITQHLGMKPMSHEYKVMGLAPYAVGDERRELVELFRKFYRINGVRPLQILNMSGRWRWHLIPFLRRLLFEHRFDEISGAVQDLFEEVVLTWVRNAVRETGIGDLALSGGGFMNVKLNGKVLSLPEVSSLFVFPSCGDESNPVGAAILAALDGGFDYREIRPLTTIDWGPEYGNEEIQAVLEKILPAEGFSVTRHEEIDTFVGKEVARGRIVGRLAGRMEWGARALGNRSILADPRYPKVVNRINKAVKKRDFWMPFAPAVLEEDRSRYLRLPESFPCHYMMVACESTGEADTSIPAALHPFDRTARPQVVSEEVYPRFHRLIRSFAEETGIGAVLNTSLNIHGEPLASSPEDAVRTLLRSDLDALQLENHYIERRRR